MTMTDKERSLLATATKCLAARGITLTIEGDEMVYSADGEVIKKEPLALLTQRANALVIEPKTDA